ncbi:hypothetical protein [Sorangium sp. So ce1182]|uniref:hypothetical protein n=1 Tax=Sorangium sp. So ce1182 TaxID=3133334 RepID=UPI003F5FA55E
MSGCLFMCGVGLVTPVGHTAEDTYWSTLTGIRRFRRGPVVGFDGHPLRVSPVLPISPACVGIERRHTLLSPALVEAVGSARRATGALLSRAGLVLCPGFDDRTFFPRGVTRLVLPMITAALGQPVDNARIDASPEGWHAQDLLARAIETLRTHARLEVPEEWCAIVLGEHSSGIAALDRAAEILRARGADWCIVAAVDSACEAGRLEALAAAGRIQSQRVRAAPIPGEAAAVMCLRRDPPRAGAAAAHKISRWAHGREDDNDDPALGATWSEVIEVALSGAEGETRPLAFTMVDLNGELARAQAWSFAEHRTLGRRGLTPEVVHPADTVGDVLAATGPMLLALAGRRLSLDAPAASALVACAATFGRERSAAIITVAGVRS